MVRPCVLRHRVTVLTLCPLGEPEIAIGHEPRIEPWLPRNRIACQVSRIGGRRHHSKNEPRERKSHPEKNLSSDREPSANSGLDIETKNLSATGRGRTFFVDIPFYRTTYLVLRWLRIYRLIRKMLRKWLDLKTESENWNRTIRSGEPPWDLLASRVVRGHSKRPAPQS